MKKCKQPCSLNNCFLCRNVLKDWLPLLDLNRKTFQVKKGELLFVEGDVVEGIYFLEKGIVKVHQQWTDDKELIIRFAGAGTIVGHRGLGAGQHYPVSATALEPSLVCFVQLDFFHATLRTNPALTHQLLLFFAEELRESEQRMRNMARLTVKSRVAAALLHLAEKFGSTEEGWLQMVVSRQDLAAYVGATYETVFRMLQELGEEGLLLFAGKNIAIRDAAALRQIAAPGRAASK